MKMVVTPIKERTAEQLQDGIEVNENTLANLRAGAVLAENAGKTKTFTDLIERVQKVIGDLKKELARKGGE